MTLAEMRDSLRRKIGNPTTTDVSNSSLNQVLNEAQRYIMDVYPFRASRKLWLIDTVSGTHRYTLPTDLGTLYKVGHRDSAYSRMRIRRADAMFQFREGTPDANSTGVPAEFTQMNDWIQLYPVPDGVYTIALFYKTIIADLTNDSDESPIPATWHHGIVRYARYLFFDDKGDFGKAQYAYQAWTLWVADKPSELQDELAADSDGGIELPTLRGGDPDANRYRRGFDYDN